jgi:hypothetical protein
MSKSYSDGASVTTVYTVSPAVKAIAGALARLPGGLPRLPPPEPLRSSLTTLQPRRAHRIRGRRGRGPDAAAD